MSKIEYCVIINKKISNSDGLELLNQCRNYGVKIDNDGIGYNMQIIFINNDLSIGLDINDFTCLIIQDIKGINAIKNLGHNPIWSFKMTPEIIDIISDGASLVYQLGIINDMLNDLRDKLIECEDDLYKFLGPNNDGFSSTKSLIQEAYDFRYKVSDYVYNKINEFEGVAL